VTSHAVEENLEYLDETPEVIGTSAADGWHAVLQGERGLRAVPLVAWAQRDDDVFIGICAPRGDANVDLTKYVAEHPGFRGFIRPHASVDVALLTGADIKELLSRQTINKEDS